MPYTLHQHYIVGTANRPNRPFPSGRAASFTVHETGNPAPGASARAHALYLYALTEQKSWHATVDEEEVWESLRPNEQGWHAGDGSGPGNTTSYALELCVAQGMDPRRVRENAIEYIVYRHRVDGIPLDLRQHHQWSGKNCPETIRATPGEWERFITQVALKAEAADAANPEPTTDEIVNRLAAAYSRIEQLELYLGWRFSNAQRAMLDAAHAFDLHQGPPPP